MQQRAILFAALILVASIVPSARAQLLKHPDVDNPSREVMLIPRTDIPRAIADRAYFWLDGKWPADADGFFRIRVCWEDYPGFSADQHSRDLSQNAVLMTWSTFAPISFLGWMKCTDTEPQSIRIAVRDDYWPVSQLGHPNIAGTPSGLKLNFTFARVAPQWVAACSDPASRDGCIYKTAAHEFGHALGFMHEQDRGDTPDNCLATKDSMQALQSRMTRLGTHWDPESIMNYCNPTWINGGHLSQEDIIALQRVYGAPR
jgi:hypothetical protein